MLAQDMGRKKNPLHLIHVLEKQMSLVSTHEVFKKFQIEVLGISGCHLMEKNVDGHITTFKVLDFQKNEEFVVEWDVSEEKISCLCCLFEYNGYLCRHSLMVLQAIGVFAVPSHYILRRWTKDIRSKHNKRKVNEEAHSKKERYDHLFQKVSELLEEGSLTNESYNFACHALEETLKQCAAINQHLKFDKHIIIQGGNDICQEDVDNNILCEKSLRDPQVSKTKGAPRRIKSSIEKYRKRKSSGKLKKETLMKTSCIEQSSNQQVQL